MTIRLLPFLLALILVATPMSPAIADTPSSAEPPLYARVISGSLGALQELQFQLMTRSLEWELDAFTSQTGDWPSTGSDALATGFLPFVPINTTGRPVAVTGLDLQQHPPEGALGLQLRDTEATLMQLGADGDPLTPYLKSVNRRPASGARWKSPFAWSARMASVVETSLIAQCEAVLNLTDALPQTPDALTKHTGLVPRGWTWHAAVDPAATGVALEIDATHRYLRTTIYPQQGPSEPTVYRIADSHPYELDRWPYGLALIDRWELIGMLRIDAPLAATPLRLVVTSEKTEIASSFSAQLTGQWVLLTEYCRLASWRKETTGDAPSTEWLLEHDLTLHRFRNSEGEVVQPTPIPLDPNRTPGPVAHPRIPPDLMDSDILLQADGNSICIAAEFPPTSHLPRGVSAEAGGRKIFGPSSMRFDVFSAAGFGRQQALAEELPAEAAEVAIAIAADRGGAPNSVSTALWADYEGLKSGFSYRMLSLAGDSFAQCLQNWGFAHADEPLPSWDALLESVQLARHGYHQLAPGATVGPDECWVEVAVSADQHCYRITMHHPSGLQRSTYGRVVTLADSHVRQGMSTGAGSEGSPAYWALDYTPVATFVIPIPDPPSVPEVPAP